MKASSFTAIALCTALLVAGTTSALVTNDYFFSASYTVLQFVVLATAWNILGGFTGYVNFGSAAFFALGAYSSIVLDRLFEAPIALSILSGAAVAGLVGLGMGYLTLRLRGVFFAIATLAFAEVLFTFVVNWDYVGGARGAYVVLQGRPPLGFRSFVQFTYDEACYSIFHHLRNRSTFISDHRSAARHRLNHDQPERLGPTNWKQ